MNHVPSSDNPLSVMAEQLLNSFEQIPDRAPTDMPSKAQARALKFAYEHDGELTIGGEKGCKIRRDIVGRLVAKGLISSSPALQESKYSLTPAGRAFGSYYSERGEPI